MVAVNSLHISLNSLAKYITLLQHANDAYSLHQDLYGYARK